MKIFTRTGYVQIIMTVGFIGGLLLTGWGQWLLSVFLYLIYLIGVSYLIIMDTAKMVKASEGSKGFIDCVRPITLFYSLFMMGYTICYIVGIFWGM